MIYITTDWHLFHRRMEQLCNRHPNYNEMIIQNFKQLKHDDTIINLGDLIFYRNSELAKIMYSLPGKHILILGNHDRSSVTWYKSKGFHWVSRQLEYDNILFSHKPQDLTDRPHIKYNIHGHFHTNDRSDIKRTQAYYPFYTEKHLLLSLEYSDYKPVLLETFLNQHGNNL